MRRFEHGGNIHQRGDVIDFSANINPLGPPEWLRGLVSRHLEEVEHYPDPAYVKLRAALAAAKGRAPAEVVVANGTSELLQVLLQALATEGYRRLLLPVPSYVDYARAAELAGIEILPLPLPEAAGFIPDFAALSDQLSPGDLLILATPNNPTGSLPPRAQIQALAAAHPKALVILDEAFSDFIEAYESLGATADNLLSLNSMTKFYGVPGLRLGYGLLPAGLAERVRAQLPPWSVSSLADAFGRRALLDPAYAEESRAACARLRASLTEALTPMPLSIAPSAANFLFLRLERHDSAQLYEACAAQGLLIRRCDNYLGLKEPERCVRIAVRPESENALLCQAFRDFFGLKRPRQKERRAKAIMFQGTTSDAGKSVLTAGLCRILVQDGVSVAPFKAQNMSNNSFVTRGGEEMGRAQVVQAQAALLDPDVRMNPVLLKPNRDTGSQVVVAGHPVGDMGVGDYAGYKRRLWPKVTALYDSLAAEHEVIVLEGAGSPGEINLKAGDIVNMRMARHAKAPVLLVGDIDRGGVYAAFIGIMETLAQWERALLSGFIVNKFRGDASLLGPAHDAVEAHTGRPVLGVLPWQTQLGLPEEDAVSFKAGAFNQAARRADAVEIAVLDLPHISNFTDVEPLLAEPDVELRVVAEPGALGRPDALIIPGTKNVLGDLAALRARGLDGAVRQLREAGTEIVGICGGYQLLGAQIEDPLGVESAHRAEAGLGLLPLKTVIEADKTLRLRRGLHRPSGQAIRGYEIHHGRTEGGEGLLSFEGGEGCGAASPDGLVWGAYLHGIFDADDFRRWFIDRLRQRRGLTPVGRVLAPWALDAAFDRLAEAMREGLDMQAIYRLIGI